MVARLSKNLFRQSAVGGIFTRESVGPGEQHLVGADAQFATSNFSGRENLSLDLYLFRNRRRGNAEGGLCGALKIDYPNIYGNRICLETDRQISSRRSASSSPDIRKSMLGIEFMPRPERYGIRQLFFEFDVNHITDLNNVVSPGRVRLGR